jgi:hypothetical protein
MPRAPDHYADQPGAGPALQCGGFALVARHDIAFHTRPMVS